MTKLVQIESVQQHQNGAQIELDNTLQKEFQIQLEEEDVKWNQRAKQHWLKQGTVTLDSFTARLLKEEGTIKYL